MDSDVRGEQAAAKPNAMRVMGMQQKVFTANTPRISQIELCVFVRQDALLKYNGF